MCSVRAVRRPAGSLRSAEHRQKEFRWRGRHIVLHSRWLRSRQWRRSRVDAWRNPMLAMTVTCEDQGWLNWPQRPDALVGMVSAWLVESGQLKLFARALRAAGCRRRQGIFRPRVLWVAAAQVCSDVLVTAPPETREIAGHRYRSMGR